MRGARGGSMRKKIFIITSIYFFFLLLSLAPKRKEKAIAMKIFHKCEDGQIRLNYKVFLRKFLEENEVVRYEKAYYRYYSEQGIWKPMDLEDIQLEAARFLESETGRSWNVGYKKQTLERLKVAIHEVEEMNQPDEKICLKNGVLDVGRGSFRKQFDKSCYFTNRLEVDFDREAKAPLFEKFLDEASCGNQCRKRTLEEFMGLALTKKIGKGKAMVLRGTGNNGKSVYLNILCELLGTDRWTSISIKELPNFGASVLPGKTLAVMSEISEENSRSLMTTELKQLITGENMWCNIKYQNAKSIKPCVKVLILTNHRIGTNGDDSEGALRRLFILPFEYHVPDKDVDLELIEKLKGELSGILNIAVRGYRRLVRQGFVYSAQEESDRLIDGFLKNENPMRSFIKEKIAFQQGAKMSYLEFNRQFQEWGKANEIDIPTELDSKQIFSEVEKHYGVERCKSNGMRGMKNIVVKE